MATGPRANVVLDGDVGPLRQKLREGAQQINQFGRDGSGALGDMLAPAQALQQRLGGIVSVIAGGAFAAFVKTSINIQDEMSKSAQRAGVTTEQFSSMAYAARLASVDVGLLEKSYGKLSTLLLQAQQGKTDAVQKLATLKIDPAGLKDADALLLALSERFAAMPDGVDKTAMAVSVLGEELGPRLIPMLNQGVEGITALREEAARLGVVVDTEAGRAAEAFNDNLTRMQTSVQGVAMRLTTALLPGLTAVADEFGKVRTEGGAVEVLGKGLRTVFETLAVLGANVAFVFAAVGREIGAWAAQLGALLRRDLQGFRAISDAVKADGERAVAELKDFEDRVMQLGKYAPGAGGAGAPAAAPPPPFKPLPAPAPKPGEKSQMAVFELQLAEEKRVASILEAGREYAKERELAYWRAILASTQLSSNDRNNILRRAAALEVQIAGAAAKERAALESETLAQTEALALGRLDGERAAAKLALDLGQITQGQHLAMQAQFEDQRFQIMRAALEQRLQLLAQDPDSSEVEKQRLVGRLLALEQQYQQRKLDIQGSMAQAGGFGGSDAFTEMGNAWGRTLNDMAAGTATWYGTLSGIFSDARDVFMRTMITEPFGQYVAAQARMLAVKLGFISQEKAAQAAGSTATVGIKAAETTAVVGANAAQAGAGAAASQAAIPVVGPYLALAAMAAVFAAVSAMGRKSAAGGYDIPSGVNPMTQLHEEEMVLPKHLANAVRGMTGKDGAAAGGGAGGGDVHVSVRGASAGDFFMLHKTELVKAMKAARRDLAF